MKMKLVFLIAFLSFFSCGKKQDAPPSSSHLSTLMHAEKTSDTEFLNVVQVNIGWRLCSGTIIHPRIILSAAHCFYNTIAKATVNIIYQDNKALLKQTIKISKYFIPKEYKTDSSSEEYDLAVLILEENALLSQDKYIKLASKNTPYETGTNALLVGLGNDEFNSNSGIKRKKSVKLLNDYFCNPSDDYLRLEEATNSGDSGGAAFITDENNTVKQIGVISSMTTGFLGMCYGSNIIDLRIYLDWIFEVSGYKSHSSILEITKGLTDKNLI